MSMPITRDNKWTIHTILFHLHLMNYIRAWSKWFVLDFLLLVLTILAF